MEFKLYTEDLEPSVRAFNRRLRDAGESFTFPESHVPRFSNPGIRPYQEMYLIAHENEIRGAYQLTHERFAIAGEIESVACGPQFNLSEGIVDRRYGMVGAFLVQHALNNQPLMYALGIGGMNERQAKLLIAIGWTLYPLPFFFRVLRPSRFLANIYLRKRQDYRLVLDLSCFTGLGWLGLRVAQLRWQRFDKSMRTESIESFDKWADKLWESCKSEYSLISQRDHATLNVTYPPSNPRFLRIRVCRADKPIGWAVLLDSQMSGHKHFGNMRVGSIVDCLARPEDAYIVVRAATDFFERRGVDLIVSNQANGAWCRALAKNGFLRGPSNFILGLSQDLSQRIGRFEEVKGRIHMTRGNGDGPIHL